MEGSLSIPRFVGGVEVKTRKKDKKCTQTGSPKICFFYALSKQTLWHFICIHIFSQTYCELNFMGVQALYKFRNSKPIIKPILIGCCAIMLFSLVISPIYTHTGLQKFMSALPFTQQHWATRCSFIFAYQEIDHKFRWEWICKD